MFKDCSELRHCIVLLRYVETGKDSYGRARGEWRGAFSLRAAVRDISAREFFVQDADMRENVVTFSTRHDERVNESLRVRFNGDIYEILYINHLGYKGRQMEIKCRRVAGEAQGNGAD